MTTQSPFALEEQPGTRYPSLEAVQRLSMEPMAVDLATTLKGLLASGQLVLDQGRIIPKQRKDAYQCPTT